MGNFEIVIVMPYLMINRTWENENIDVMKHCRERRVLSIVDIRYYFERKPLRRQIKTWLQTKHPILIVL